MKQKKNDVIVVCDMNRVSIVGFTDVVIKEIHDTVDCGGYFTLKGILYKIYSVDYKEDSSNGSTKTTICVDAAPYSEIKNR